MAAPVVAKPPGVPEDDEAWLYGGNYLYIIHTQIQQPPNDCHFTLRIVKRVKLFDCHVFSWIYFLQVPVKISVFDIMTGSTTLCYE